jgi:hypothetical protein
VDPALNAIVYRAPGRDYGLDLDGVEAALMRD